MNTSDRVRSNAVIGAAIKRLEDPRLIKGQGCFVDDVQLPHLLHATVVRSPHAHARITDIDLSETRRLSGVVAAFAFEDISEWAQPIPVRLNPYGSLKPFLQYPLAHNRVRYVGEPVALVVAESRYRAEDALETIHVEYEPLPAVVNPEAAPPAAALHEAALDNVASHFVMERGDVEQAFAEADHVVKARFATGRHTGMPLETRGLVALYDESRDRLRVWGPTKVPHFNRGILARMLRLPEHRIQFIEPDVGGSFGVRGEFYPEDFLIPFAALRLGRPIKWIEDRLEHLVACNHSRQQVYHMELALRRDGTLLGARLRLVNDMGAYIRTHGVIVPELSAGMFPGPYRLPNYRGDVRCVLTNKTPTGTYRAPGRFETNAARERLLDLAAGELGLDPAELRMKNLLLPEELPYRPGTHSLGEEIVYDSGDYPYALREALNLCDYQVHQQRERKGGVRRIGLGLACFVEKTGLGPFEGARVAIDPSGHVVVSTGASSVGQGLETVLAQIAAQVLGVPPEEISVQHGDTDLIPYSVGSFASRTTVLAGNAVYQAAQQVRDKLLRLAARAGPHDCAPGEEPSLESTCYFHTERMTYSHGVVVAQVEMDTRTGEVTPTHVWVVYDVGNVINPQMVTGQIQGGVAQGLGGALLEELVYDTTGQLISGTFMDYLLPTAAELPPVTLQRLERSPSPLNPLGVKGAGECGIAGMGAALANAVADALGPAGRRVDRLPLTPERVWRWLQVDEEEG
ncbi:MAG: xanthine dehydrogenase family protein molybdopterin-binding subunit [Candidatus Bipolaricaulia bacterium]